MATRNGVSTGIVDNASTLHALDRNRRMASQPAARETTDFANQLDDHTWDVLDRIRDTPETRPPQLAPRGQSTPNFNFQPLPPLITNFGDNNYTQASNRETVYNKTINEPVIKDSHIKSPFTNNPTIYKPVMTDPVPQQPDDQKSSYEEPDDHLQQRLR
ncbi:uncharacterized protein DFL_003087 [Arthrobotrys flagrans]|uniref:Uncharacterized protein n=1 Tax=Arthrobotrys flagrans TaxID=97331 RepID=A0A437ACD5_ARTFL|nr:hypothetical protein DFL_003087 [Arthrobotrys flagrans]